MKTQSVRRLILMLCCLPVLAAMAQDTKLPKDVERRYDKFRDLDIWSTKATDLPVKFGEIYSAAGFSAAFIREKGKPVELVGLCLLPTAVTLAGGLSQTAAGLSLDSRNVGKNRPAHDGSLYFRPKAEVILMIGAQRITLPPSDKPFPFGADGEYQGATTVILPAEVFLRLAAAESWSLLIGDVATGLGDRDVVKDHNEKAMKKWRERVQPRLLELKKLIEDHNAGLAK